MSRIAYVNGRYVPLRDASVQATRVIMVTDLGCGKSSGDGRQLTDEPGRLSQRAVPVQVVF